MIVNSDDKTNFPHKLILTNRQVKNIPKTFANNLSGNINGLSLMKNVLKPSAKSVLIPLRLTAVASAATTLIISNKEGEDIMKIVKSLEDSGLLLKGVGETIQNEGKEQKRRFLSMLLGTLGVSSLGKILAGKGINRAGYVSKDLRSKKDGMIRASNGSKRPSIKDLQFEKKKKKIPPHPLTNFKIQKHYQNESKLNGVYSRNNLLKKIKDGTSVIILTSIMILELIGLLCMH